MALKFRKKVMLAKVEDTYGTDASPAANADAILASEISIQPMQGADADRGHDTIWLGNAGTIPYDLHAVLSFQVELAGSGSAGTAPAWAPLMLGCGCGETVVADTSVAYAPISDAHSSLTLTLNIDGVLFKLLGARGTCVINLAASAVPRLEFTFTGWWVKPVDAALPASVDYSAFEAPLIPTPTNTPTFTLGGTTLCARSFQLDLGNEVELRKLINCESVQIVDRAETIQTQVEMTTMATFDPYALARDAGTQAIALTHGTQAGNIVSVAVPAAQMMRPGDPTEAQGIVELPLNMRPLPQSGNDQWTLTLT